MKTEKKTRPETLEELEQSGLSAIRVDHVHAVLKREMGPAAPSRTTLFRALKDGTFWAPRLNVGRAVYVPVAPFIAGLKGLLK